MRHPIQKSGLQPLFLCMANQMCQMMAKDNETAKFIFSAAVRFSKRMPSVVPLSVIFDQLIVS
ncbi:hypothetical protein DSF06_02820 [Salmonella enterica subsp. enterica]|nr:hypothetical protein [Salmonella enterica subsp. enterica serovar Veneziana]EAA7083751.1 hypothetical protein [Salmonella enterica subsp. enterica serovar Veneziana]EBV3061161.1 hypothetical protein [Salmonella enterica subsp. enterica serovar Veneziana]KSU45864.1 hypothetical protein ABI57_05555 [Salmonella enterica subsp. enterica serovar Veneziana]